ncbi:MAG TPA: hypothetical protein VGG46_08350 [Terriglobales bacterium]|jgi:hypothetical protein
MRWLKQAIEHKASSARASAYFQVTGDGIPRQLLHNLGIELESCREQLYVYCSVTLTLVTFLLPHWLGYFAITP